MAEGEERKEIKEGLEQEKIVEENKESGTVTAPEEDAKEIKHVERNVDTSIAERKEKFVSFFKGKGHTWVYLVLLAILIIAVIFIRTANVPYLKDATTGGYTLGPDLDPFFFLRYAKTIVETGGLPEIDHMRYVPLGISTSHDTQLLPYSIAYFYHFLSIFNSNVSVEYAAIIFPVVFFSLALVVFFLLVRKLFEKNKYNNVIALVSTAFIAFVPSMLHRMTAGIPEKESMGMFFFFLALMFFVYGYNSEKSKKTLIYGALAGASTGLLAQVWGGVSFIFIIVGLFGLVLLLLNQVNKRIFLLYGAWVLFSIIFATGSTVFGFPGFFQNVISLSSFLVFLLICVHLFLREKVEKILKIENKLPPALLSVILGIIISLILAILVFGPGYISNSFNTITTTLLHPMGVDRLTLTVAENNQPYFGSWHAEFGLSFFWIFFFASIFIFFEAMNVLKLKNKILLTCGYSIMLFALVFSRYSSASELNGTSALSRTVYFGGLVLFGAIFLYIYLKDYYKNKDEFEKFSNFDKNHIFLLIWFFWTAISARGAMRLFMMLAQPAAILVSAIAVKLPQYALRSKEELSKILFWCATALVVLLLVMSFVSFAQQSSREARYTVPSYYNIQWQNAMSWVRDNTDESAVFSHWWDYGYWLQTIGQRATVLDGGNTIGYWNHLFGRHVLTGEDENEALEFLYAHDVTHLLIDSTEIGKYSAYSSIGSDEDYDRFTWIPTFGLDEKQTQETKNETMYVYVGGTMLDQDFVWEGKLFPGGKAAVGLLILSLTENGDIRQPEAILVYGGKQTRVPLRYVYLKNKLYDFETEDALQACVYIVPRVDETGINELGAALYISERGMEALWVHLYLLNEGENFKLVHNEPDTILQDIRDNYNLTISELAVYRGNLLGPIKIWEVDYPEDIKFRSEYLETKFPSEELYLSRNV